MTTAAAPPPHTFSEIPNLRELDLVATPTVMTAERKIEAVVADVDGHPITLRFQPYQAMKVTTVDCYQEPDGLPHRPRVVMWATSSPWLAELTATLATIDRTADFLQHAAHFIVPAGDDVLEVVATRAQITLPDGTILTFPPDARDSFWNIDDQPV